MDLFATTNQQTRTHKLTGKITVNGNTYEFVNGGARRGSIPFGDYALGGRHSGPRVRDGIQMTSNGGAPGVIQDPALGATRSGVVAHKLGRGGVTEGCIGIAGDDATWQRFKKDVAAERAARGGDVPFRLGPQMALGGPKDGGLPSLAQNSGAMGADPDGFAGVSGSIHTKTPPRDVGVNLSSLLKSGAVPSGLASPTGGGSLWAKIMQNQMTTNTPAPIGSLNSGGASSGGGLLSGLFNFF